MIRVATLLGLLCLAGSAQAACDPLSEEGFVALRDAAGETLARDDMAVYHQSAAELEERIPCLTNVLSVELWAPYLVQRAVAAFADGEDWQTPLASAIHADPEVDRLVGARHPMARWEPPPEDKPEGESTFPPGVVYLDGREIERLPPLRGPHLLQVVEDGEVGSVLVFDSRSAERFLPRFKRVRDPIASPAKVARRGAVPWLAAGGLMTLSGASIGVGTWASRNQASFVDMRDDATQSGNLRRLNTLGWSLCVVGLVVTGVGVQKRLSVGVGPGTLQVSGRW